MIVISDTTPIISFMKAGHLVYRHFFHLIYYKHAERYQKVTKKAKHFCSAFIAMITTR